MPQPVPPHTLRRFISTMLWVALAAVAEPARSGPVPQARFEDGLVFIDTPAPDHSSLHMLAVGDAGAMLLSSEAAARLQLRLSAIGDPDILMQLGPAAQVAETSSFMRQHWPMIAESMRFLVIPGVIAVKGWPPSADGVLGRAWFAGRTWTWDYPRRRLILRDNSWQPPPDARALPIRFEAARGASPALELVSITISGQEIAVRLDTGAATVLSPAALRELHDGAPALRAASTLAHRTFEGLHLQHRNWRIIEDATIADHSRMLRVPTVRLAGEAAGPVWFIEQSDQPRVAQGSIGGNLLSRFELSVDYPRSRAWTKLKLSRH
jgi:hypothetical protein